MAKKEMSLTELAAKDLKMSKKTEEQVKRQKFMIKYLSVTGLCVVISAVAGVYSGLRKVDKNTDHLEDYCIYCNVLGLKHQQKMIDKQYGDAIETELVDDKRLNVYYIDDDYQKHLIKSFISGNKR